MSRKRQHSPFRIATFNSHSLKIENNFRPDTKQDLQTLERQLCLGYNNISLVAGKKTHNFLVYLQTNAAIVIDHKGDTKYKYITDATKGYRSFIEEIKLKRTENVTFEIPLEHLKTNPLYNQRCRNYVELYMVEKGLKAKADINY